MINPIIRQIVDRQIVSDSNLSICRAIYKSLKRKFRHDPKYKDIRKQYYKDGILVHKENKDLYFGVMNANI